MKKRWQLAAFLLMASSITFAAETTIYQDNYEGTDQVDSLDPVNWTVDNTVSAGATHDLRVIDEGGDKVLDGGGGNYMTSTPDAFSGTYTITTDDIITVSFELQKATQYGSNSNYAMDIELFYWDATGTVKTTLETGTYTNSAASLVSTMPAAADGKRLGVTVTFTGAWEPFIDDFEITAVTNDGPIVGNAAGNFAGEQHADLDIPLPLTTEMTIEAWVKTSFSGVQTIFNWNNGGSNAIFQIRDAKVFFGQWDGSSWKPLEAAIPAELTNQWVHVAAVRDVANSIQFYVNGVAVGAPGVIDNDIVPTANRIGAVTSGSERFEGVIDQLRIWDIARTQTQIASDMGKEVLATATNLVAAWRFNEGTGSTLGDATDTYNATVTTPNAALFWVEGAPVDSVTPAIGLSVTQTDNELSWTAEEEIGVKEYQVINAETGELLETVVATGGSSYATVIPEGVEAKLVVVDKSGYTQTFIPANGNIEAVTYDLTEGWNLITITGDNADSSAIESAFWGWNGTAYEVVTNPQPTKAVWVYLGKNAQVTVTGEKSNAEIKLTPGWNMVGPVENCKIPENAHTVYGWNETYQNIATEDEVLIQGIGYWIFSIN